MRGAYFVSFKHMGGVENILFCRSALAEFVGELTKSDGDMPFLPTPVRVAASSSNDDSTFDRLTSRPIPS